MSEQSSAPDATDDVGDAAVDGAGADAETADASSARSPGEGPRVVGVDSTDADAVLGAVSSDTAREVLCALHEEPAPASRVADRLDRSLQTVQYHLANLEDAGLVEVVDTATSEKGRPMDVYGPVGQPVVVYAGDDDGGDDLRTALSRLVSGVALLALASLLVQELFGDGIGALLGRGRDASVQTAAEAADAAGGAGGGAAPAAGLEPGLVFFAGGLAVLVVGFAAWYLRRRGAFAALSSRI